MKYKKKPLILEVFRYDGDLANSNGEYYVPEWAVEAYKSKVLYYDSINQGYPPYELFIKTLEGNLHVSVGDYIIQGTQGEVYPCRANIFKDIYEKIE